MNKLLIPIATLIFAGAACAPDDPAEELTPEAETDGTNRAVERDPPPVDRTKPDTTQQSASSTDTTVPGEYVGKFVVNSKGERLGEVKRIVQDRGNGQTFAVVSLADTEREVIVPLTELDKGTQLTNLNLDMTREQLSSQPDAGENDYVEIRQSMDLESEGHLSS